jgi:carbon-monoxide dehydrogenase medium subunit
METYHRPDSVAEAQQTLEDTDESVAVIAGGQEVMVDLRNGTMSPQILVDISEITELNTISRTDDGVQIGACVTYNDIETSSVIRSEFPYLVETIETIAGPQVRNNGTLGGALCDADPVFDAPPVLLTLDATVTVGGPNSNRKIPLVDLYEGEQETVLREAEILRSIHIPNLPPRSAGTYRSMTPQEGSATVAGVAVRLSFTDGTCHTARIALTNAADAPVRVPKAEAVLEDTSVDDVHITRAVEALHETLTLPESDEVSRSYRESVFRRLTGKAIQTVRDDLLEGTDD